MVQRIILFLSSYSPVFVLLAFQAPGAGWWYLIRLSLFALALVGLLGLWLILAWTRGKHPQPVRVTARKDAGAESAAFLAGYLLPLITATVNSVYAAWATAVYLLLAAIITVRSSLIQVNPILLLLGFRIVQVSFVSDPPSAGKEPKVGEGYFVTRHRVFVGERWLYRRLGADVHIASPADTPGEKIEQDK